jgi:predicted ester cyclase
VTAPLERLADVGHYFDSWSARDSASLLAAFAQGGTYTDPTVTGSPLSGSALEAHVGALFSAFPDLDLHVVSAQASDGDINGDSIVARWLMRGTHAGRLYGLPTLGRLPGSSGC